MKAHEEVRHLEWRVRLFGAGAILALVGMVRNAEWLVNLAIGVLLLGFALRFVPERGGDEEGGERAEDGPRA
ncbi:MAG: hypothetical protein KY453_12660 [Gemmatimonadetes bacterium]|nr:hypothetical protein [Gemmatimonadota bacterium]